MSKSKRPSSGTQPVTKPWARGKNSANLCSIFEGVSVSCLVSHEFGSSLFPIERHREHEKLRRSAMFIEPTRARNRPSSVGAACHPAGCGLNRPGQFEDPRFPCHSYGVWMRQPDHMTINMAL